MRLTSLDLVRGIAAVSVVIFHFQHMAAFGQDPQSWAVALDTLPFYTVLKPIYSHGWMAVDLFFVISGFIFAWLYGQSIIDRRVNFFDFMILRLTRLYPLHILTLFVVLALQSYYAASMGMFFIMPYNDAYHFGLNIGFLGGWGLERGASFNGPSWSISVEMALYIIFFATCRLFAMRVHWAALALACLGLFVQTRYPLIGRGITGYFVGVITYFIFAYAMKRPNAERIAYRATVLVAAAWVLVLLLYYLDATNRFAAELGLPQQAFLIGKLGTRLVIFLLFPLTIFALALLESAQRVTWRHGPFLGEISYSSYLIHFPLQLVFANLAARGILHAADLTSTACLIAFGLILVPLAWLTFHYVELPLQQLGRRLFLGRSILRPSRDEVLD